MTDDRLQRTDETTFSEKVRQAARQARVFRAGDLADLMKVQIYKDRKRVRKCIGVFARRGEMKRVARGKYRYVPGTGKVTGRQRLWNVVRRMPGPYFSLDDIEQLTGIKRKSIKEFCGFLVKEGCARRIMYGHFKRIKEFEVDVPPDRQKIERLRGIRGKRNGTRMDTDGHGWTRIKT